METGEGESEGGGNTLVHVVAREDVSIYDGNS